MTCLDSSPLPGVLAEIESITRREVALQLALACGGQRIYIPSGAVPKAIRAAVSPSAAETICAHFAGDTLTLPLANPAVARWLASHPQATTASIAATLRVPVRSVARWLQKNP